MTMSRRIEAGQVEIGIAQFESSSGVALGKVGFGHLCVALGVYIAGLLAYAALRPPKADHIDADNPRLVAWGKIVYADHCAACHGTKLEGQPGWRRPGLDGRLPAPPHDESGHTWHHDDRYLIHVVLDGIVAGVDRPPDYQGNMPAFGAVLTRQETVAALSFIKNSWSFDYREWQGRSNGADQE